MPAAGQALVVQYVAWDWLNGGLKTGDVANHTLRWIQADGTEVTPAGSPSEIDATNSPGYYKVAITTSECGVAGTARLIGKSSTSGVSVIGPTVCLEPLPPALTAGGNVKADAIAVGGTAQTGRDLGASVLVSVGTGAGQINASGGKVPATVAAADVSGNPSVTVADYATGKVPLQPTTAGRTLDVAATGEAGLDFDNVRAATAPTTLTNITVPTVTTLTDAPSDPSGVTTLLARIASAITIGAGGKVAATVASGDDTDAASVKATIGAAGAGLTALGDSRLAYLDQAVSAAKTLTGAERNAVAAALLDLADAIETGFTPRMAIRIMAAALAGKVSGAAANAPIFRAIDDGKARITATTDADGNRLTIVLDGT